MPLIFSIWQSIFYVIGFDCTMVLVSAVTCLAVLHNLGSVGIGTIIAAVLAGTVVGIITKAFGKQRDKILGKTDEDLRCKERHTNIDYYVCMPFFIVSPKLNCSQFSGINCSISENISLSQISHLLNAAKRRTISKLFFQKISYIFFLFLVFCLLVFSNILF